MTKNPTNIRIDETLLTYHVNPKNGLSSQQYTEKKNIYGLNKIKEKKSKSGLLIFLKTLIEPIQLILLFASLISLLTTVFSPQRNQAIEYLESIIIFSIVLIDGGLQTFQQIKAIKSVNALQKLIKPRCIVLREGQQIEIDADELTIGDVVILEAGRYVPADLRLIESSNLTIDESTLTGESTIIEKAAIDIVEPVSIISEMKNMAFMSTYVITGRAVGVVVKIGDDTQIGKIANLINNSKSEKTSLEQNLTKFSYAVALISVIVGLAFFAMLMLKSNENLNEYWIKYLTIAVTLAIGLIPECLSSVISITLSISTKRMVKNNMIVKKLSVIEALGRVDVICTDKTGTLTQNKMTIQQLIYNCEKCSAGIWFDKFQDNLFYQKTINAMVLCNDSTINNEERIGDPTELAFIDYVNQIGIDEKLIREKYGRVSEIPFDSSRKMMTTLNKVDGNKTVFSKGGIEQILQVCTKIVIDDKICKLTKNIQDDILAQALEMSKDSLRVLALAYKEDVKDNQNLESNLIFLGAVAIKDPIRQEAVETIKIANKNSIKVIMITGDHPETALSIAKELGLAENQNQVMSANEFIKMSNENILKIIDHIKVFARVNPEHKVKIIDILHKKGYICSMTGDGVNDGPSLARADVGIAMGVTGTDVAKQASDLILTDDNLFTIVKGIWEGRDVYKRIQKALVFVMGVNIGNLISLALIILLQGQSPFTAINILWINLVVETILATSIGAGKTEETYLKYKKKKRNLFDGVWWAFIKIVVLISTSNFLAYYLAYYLIDTSDQQKELYARSSFFFTASTSPALFINTIRIYPWNNVRKFRFPFSKAVFFSAMLAICLNLIIMFIPFLNSEIFELASIADYQDNLIILSIYLIALLPFITFLAFDFLGFAVKYYFPKSWERNQKIVKEVVK